MISEFYTYMWLREDGTPYYVGKGKDKRAFREGCPRQAERILIQECLSENEAFEVEKFFISFYGRKDIETGLLWNRTDGGEGISGWLGSKEEGRKVGKSNKGRIYTEQERKRISDQSKRLGLKPPPGSHKGFPHSEMSKKKMSDKLRGRTAWNRGILGSTVGHIGKFTAEHRFKLSLAAKNRKRAA